MQRGLGEGRGSGDDLVDKFKASWRVNQAVEVPNPIPTLVSMHRAIP